MFSCQTWHRGAPNQSDRTRYVTQVSYAHRTIGHRYYPFMNYVLQNTFTRTPAHGARGYWGSSQLARTGRYRPPSRLLFWRLLKTTVSTATDLDTDGVRSSTAIATPGGAGRPPRPGRGYPGHGRQLLYGMT